MFIFSLTIITLHSFNHNNRNIYIYIYIFLTSIYCMCIYYILCKDWTMETFWPKFWLNAPCKTENQGSFCNYSAMLQMHLMSETGSLSSQDQFWSSTNPIIINCLGEEGVRSKFSNNSYHKLVKHSVTMIEFPVWFSFLDLECNCSHYAFVPSFTSEA